MVTSIYHCRNCDGSPLIRAHLFPKAFCQKIGLDFNGNLEDFAYIRADRSRYKAIKTGIFDDKILCAACDQKLGKLDKYAFEWTEQIKRTVVYRYPNRLPALVTVSGESRLLLLFALSILWRFSASERPEAGPIHLGPYFSRLSSILFRDGDVNANIDCTVRAARAGYPGAENLFRTPIPIRNSYINGFYFYINGFEYLIRLGAERKSSSDIVPRDAWLRLSRNISFVLDSFEETKTGKNMIELERRGNPACNFLRRPQKITKVKSD